MSSSGRSHVDFSFFTKEQVMACDVFHAFATHVGLVHDITATSFLRIWVYGCCFCGAQTLFVLKISPGV